MNVAKLFGVPYREGLLFGCEFEIENIRSTKNGDSWFSAHSIKMTEDNSLRGEGAREFITPPLTLEGAVELHDEIYNKQLNFSGPHSSDRCSIHAHVNFSDVEIDKVRQFILLYALLEPMFFRMVNETRQNNIYCVPLSFTFLNKYYPSKDLSYLVDKWSKYTAFNILPLNLYGTIEFRHLQGTEDNKLFKQWLTIIKNLYDVNLKITLDNKVLDQQFVLELYKEVFGDYLMLFDNEVIKILENTYIDVKLAILNPTHELLISRIKEHNLTV